MRATSKNFLASILLATMASFCLAIPAHCKLSQDSPPEELRSFAQSINEIPNPSPEQLLKQANAYRWLKEYKSAIKTLDKLVILKPSDSVVHAFRGVMYKFDERYKDAKDELDRAEKLGYRRPNLYAERSAVLLNLSDYAGSLRDANKAVEAEPADPNHRVLVGCAKAELGKPADGLYDLGKALEIDPNNAGALGARAAIYKKLGRKKEATADWERAQSLGWKSPL